MELYYYYYYYYYYIRSQDVDNKFSCLICCLSRYFTLELFSLLLCIVHMHDSCFKVSHSLQILGLRIKNREGRLFTKP